MWLMIKFVSQCSWGDYEDMHAGEHVGRAHEADGEDMGGWSIELHCIVHH